MASGRCSAAAISFHRESGTAIPIGVLQHLQPSKLRQSNQYSVESTFWPFDADIGEQSGIRGRKWRVESSVSDRRTPLDPVGTQASILKKTFSRGVNTRNPSKVLQ